MSPLAKYVVETMITLLGIVALAVVVLYGARRLGVGRPAGPLSLVGRLPLDGRRAIYLVRVGKTVYVVGASEAGLAKLGELADTGLELETEGGVEGPKLEGFKQVLARVTKKAEPGDAKEGES
ncbi:MAG: flagellar biosynthetic protein FliO [Polyangiaceae bacterium]